MLLSLTHPSLAEAKSPKKNATSAAAIPTATFMDALQLGARERQEDDGVLDLRILIGSFDYFRKEDQQSHFDNQRMYYDLWTSLVAMGYEPVYSFDPTEFGMPADYRPDTKSEMFVMQGHPWSGEGYIRIAVRNSIVFPTQGEIAKNKEHQGEQSRLSETFAQAAVRDADGFIYVGHSRDGGGPDPYPPVLLANGHTDYEHYHRLKPGMKSLEPYLKAAPKAPILIGSFSCSSLKHFKKFYEGALKGKNSSTAYVGSENVTYFTEDVPMLSELLLGVLHGDSQADIARRMNLHQKDIADENGATRAPDVMKFVPLNPKK